MRYVVVCLALLGATRAHAWDTETTHVGLTEQAALASRVHAKLAGAFGRRLGWMEPLALAPQGFAELFQRLERVAPGSGARPDRRGQQTAIAWLRAGTLLEGIPGTRNRNHFYDPVHKTGLTGRDAGGLGAFIWETAAGANLPTGGVAAPDWVTAKENELSLARFWIELERAATAPLPADRDQHLAVALLCAGALMHVLEDMGFPANARDDLREYLSPLGGGETDRGSRLARLASYVYGSLGLPAPISVERRDRWRAFFTAEDHKGLADVTAARWYSLGTLPGEVLVPTSPRPAEVLERVKESQRFPSPAPKELAFKRAATDEGAILRDGAGVCVAVYRLRDDKLSWSLPDDCAAEQLAVMLPVAANYATGFLDWLFRGELAVTVRGNEVSVGAASGLHLGKGTLRVFLEDAEGARRPVGEMELAVGQTQGRVTLPGKGGAKVIAVFRGVDEAGEELVAVGERELPTR